MAFDAELFNRACEHVANGGILVTFLDASGLRRATFYDWLDQDTSGGRQKIYDEARRRQAESWSDDIAKIADDDSQDTQTFGATKKPNREWIERTKLRVDTRKWIMARVHGRRWGDKVQQQVSGADGGPLVIRWADEAPSPTPPAPQSPEP